MIKTKEINIDNFLNGTIIKDLQDDEEVCPICNGIGLKIQDNVYGLGEKDKPHFPYKHQSIGFCQNCFNGVVKKCIHCGELLSRQKYECDCIRSHEVRAEKQYTLEYEKFDKAERIDLRDYDGYLMIGETVMDKEEFIEYYCDDFNPIHSSDRIWAVDKVMVFDKIDLDGIIEEKCYDGYEEMYEYVDMRSSLLSEAQELLDKWIIENKNQLYMYFETNAKYVDLRELHECCLHGEEYYV